MKTGRNFLYEPCSYQIGWQGQEMSCQMCPPHWNASWGKGIGYMQERILATKHEVQKKLCATYWQYVEEIITPTNGEDSMGTNKRLWGLFKHSKSDSKGVPPPKNQGHLITNVACEVTILNRYVLSVFTSHVLLDLKQLCQSKYDRVFDHTPFIPPISIRTAGDTKLSDNLKPHRATWLDDLSPMVLWE